MDLERKKNVDKATEQFKLLDYTLMDVKINKKSIIWWMGSLTGKDFKFLSQLAIFIYGDLI
ncbi:hypothetical protein HK096_000162, partial [Nowakowskiella sp. JEL0078]